ncbi:hypothetical protein HU200_067834 [Digitaria exilis]|uniref:Uncharacterized protein n=1 Tax=Digitaria exilis TaxID=1010633 RepID=A0A834ZZ26_9POAL|nr:hypothetical protein HU200_067834 [Digitaria exilis]
MGIPSRHPDHEEEEEYDDAVFYEDIQAPMFVDLTAPDAARPDDDPAWFCVRVGKDQPPRKPFSVLPSVAGSALDAKMPSFRAAEASQGPVHEVERGDGGCWEGSREAQDKGPADLCPASVPNPDQGHEDRNHPARGKKALTTPRSKTVRPRQEPFLSVKHQKEPVAPASRKGTVVKALFMSTPKKEPARTPAADKSKEAVSEVCSKLRKLNLACREVPSRQLDNNENVPLKVAKIQNKVHPEQAGKLKKTTNPRPFRLRTDEEECRKKQNQKKRQPFAENNSMAAVLKDAQQRSDANRQIHPWKGRDQAGSCGRETAAEKPQSVSRVASSNKNDQDSKRSSSSARSGPQQDPDPRHPVDLQDHLGNDQTSNAIAWLNKAAAAAAIDKLRSLDTAGSFLAHPASAVGKDPQHQAPADATADTDDRHQQQLTRTLLKPE